MPDHESKALTASAYQPLKKLFIEDDFSFLPWGIREIALWLKTCILCVSIFILALLLPIPVSLGNALLQLLTLQPLQAVKSIAGGVAATIGLLLVSCLGVFPLLLNRITASTFCPATYKKKIESDEPEKGIKTNKGWIDIGTYEPVELYVPYEPKLNQPSENYTIVFLGLLETFQKNWPLLTKMDRHILTFNYPGVNEESYRLKSSKDAVNAGIAVVYHLIEEKKWSKEKIQKNLRLEGRSLGGGIAYQVALHFREKHQIDIHVDGQNTFWSLRAFMAGQIKTYLNMPLWCGRLFSRLILSASEGFELNTLDAALKLNPEYIHFNNVKYPSKPKSTFDNIKRYFWGSPDHDADYVITDSATLLYGMKREMKKQKTQSTTTYFTQLGMVSQKERHTRHIREVGYSNFYPENEPFYKKLYFPLRRGILNHNQLVTSTDFAANNNPQRGNN